MLRNNNYPLSVINRLVNKVKQSLQPNTIPTNSTVASDATDRPIQKTFKSVTFTGDTTYQIVRVIKQMFPHIRLGFKCPTTLSVVFSKLKDQISFWQQSNLIYEIPCLDLNKKYIGLTTRQLKTRIDEHSRDYNCWLKIKSNMNMYQQSNK